MLTYMYRLYDSMRVEIMPPMLVSGGQQNWSALGKGSMQTSTASSSVA